MSFTTETAKRVMTKLGADTNDKGDHKVGIVVLSNTYRLRLYYSHGKKDLPSFIEYKWKQQLRLQHTEWSELKRCTLGGEEVLRRTKARLGLG